MRPPGRTLVRMERNDWTPAVLITATVTLVTAGLVWLMQPWGPYPEGRPGDTIERRSLPAEVVVWIGEFAPGLKGVLAPVWGDTQPDRDHDGLLNERLGLDEGRALSYYRLLVFNTTAETQLLELGDGRLVMMDENGRRVSLKSLSAMRARGEIELSPSTAFSLRSLGALSERIEIPAGRAAKLVVPFDGGARIETAKAVATTDETAFRRRQMARSTFRRLLEDPDEARVKDL